MRIWSLHPKYLDVKGLVALWRESLLAKHVLLGQTKGYKNHPQLIRFKNSDSPLDSINQYLAEIYKESQRRGYHFSREKIDWSYAESAIAVTKGQINYEKTHLLKKLALRDQAKYQRLLEDTALEIHPLFQVEDGDVEAWEII